MKRSIAATTLAALLLLANAVSACPMCKDSIPGAVSGGGDPSNMSGGGGLPGGFNSSVYVMLAGFFFALGLVGWTLYKGIKSSSTRPAMPRTLGVKPA